MQNLPGQARAPQRWSLFASHFSKNAKRLQQSFSDGAWKISRTGGRRCVLSGSILDIVVLDRHEVVQGKIIFHRYASDRTCFSAPDTGHDILITKFVATSKREKVSSPPSPRPPCPRTRHARTVACCAVIAPCARTHLQICPARRRGTTESNSYDPRACAGVRQRAAAQVGGARWRACRRRQRRRGLLYAVRAAGHRHASGGGRRSSRARSGDWVEPQQWR